MTVAVCRLPLGDAINAVLCGAGHHLRMILRTLNIFHVSILVALLWSAAVKGTIAQGLYRAK
jgi:transposase, IS5 family